MDITTFYVFYSWLLDIIFDKVLDMMKTKSTWRKFCNVLADWTGNCKFPSSTSIHVLNQVHNNNRPLTNLFWVCVSIVTIVIAAVQISFEIDKIQSNVIQYPHASDERRRVWQGTLHLCFIFCISKAEIRNNSKNKC